MDFTISDDVQQLLDKTRGFVHDNVIPFETDPRWTDHGPTDALRIELNDAALARLSLREVVTAPPIGRDGSVQDW